jgi:hypothetical protein
VVDGASVLPASGDVVAGPSATSKFPRIAVHPKRKKGAAAATIEARKRRVIRTAA